MDPADRLGAPLSPRQLQVMAEIAVHGDAKTAAACIGIAHKTAKNLLLGVHIRTGTETTIESFAVLGWLRSPFPHEVPA